MPTFFTRPELGAALTHDDVAGDDGLAAIFLHAETPPGGVAAVARRTARFLMSHDYSPYFAGNLGVFYVFGEFLRLIDPVVTLNAAFE